jgi:hypothetical protein
MKFGDRIMGINIFIQKKNWSYDSAKHIFILFTKNIGLGHVKTNIQKCHSPYVKLDVVKQINPYQAQHDKNTTYINNTFFSSQRTH